MTRLGLRYLGHQPGSSLSYFTGAAVSLVPGEIFQIPAEGLVVGRAAGAGLRVASSQVARAHVRIRPVPDQLAIEDLGTTNGTSVNGVLIRTAVVSAGDRLTIALGFDFEVIALEG